MLFLSPFVGQPGAYERQRGMAQAFAAAAWDVYWLAPGWRKPALGVALLPMVVTKEDNRTKDLGTVEFVHRALRSLRAYKQLLNHIDVAVVTREYDALAILFSKYLHAKPVILFSRGDIISNFKVGLQLAVQRRDRVLACINSMKTLWHRAVVQKFVYSRMAAIVVQSQPLKELFLSRHGAKLFRKIYVLPNNCNWKEVIDDKRKERSSSKLNRNRPLVGFFFGEGWDLKGGDLFLDAIKIVQRKINLHVIICGNAREGERHIKSLHHGNPWLLYLGFVENLAFHFGQVDLLVIPSRWDSCPNIVLEAIEAGCCVIASDITSHRYILNYDELLFPPENPVALANKIQAVLTDDNYRKRLKSLILKRRKLFRFDWGRECVKIVEDIVASS